MRKLVVSDLIIDICLGKADINALSGQQWEDVVLVLRNEQLLAYCGYLYLPQYAALPDFVVNHFKNAILLADRQATQVKFEIEELLPVIEKRSNSFLVLKGAAYTLVGGKLGEGRVYSDIDILIDRPSLKAVEQALSIRGWFSQPMNEYDEKYYREWAHEIPPLVHSNRGTVLDVHHNIVPLVSGQAPDFRLLMEHQAALKTGGAVLSPAGMFFHSSIHLFFNEEQKHGLRDLLDLRTLVLLNGNSEFWAELSSLTDSLGFKNEIFMACRYLAKLLSVQVPSEFLVSPVGMLRLAIWDSIFLRVLLPKHPIVKVNNQSLAIFFSWCRGHWCKMPIHILAYHFIMKGGRGILTSLFGKHFFTKSERP